MECAAAKFSGCTSRPIRMRLATTPSDAADRISGAFVGGSCRANESVINGGLKSVRVLGKVGFSRRTCERTSMLTEESVTNTQFQIGRWSMTDSETAPPNDESTGDELKRALKAFKKRLKLTRLDHESRLGYGPLTKGSGAGVVGIMPPHQFPPEVWEELARQNKLKHLGSGLYELMPGA